MGIRALEVQNLVPCHPEKDKKSIERREIRFLPCSGSLNKTPSPWERGKIAFTLAEVLITLGIIGIVAAMTCPTLVSKYRKAVVETSLKKTYSILTQMINRSEADNGSAVNWEWSSDIGNDIFFEKYFAPYLKITDKKVSGGSGRYFNVYDAYGDVAYNFSRFGNGNWYTLSDGSAIMFYKNEWGAKLSSFKVVVPLGSKRSHMVVGKDVFSFDIMSKNNKTSISVFPGEYTGWNCTTLNANRSTFINRCYKYDTTSGWGLSMETYCTMLIYCNDWKIPDDYPIKF